MGEDSRGISRNVPRRIVVSRDDFLKFVGRMKSVYGQNYFIQTTASVNEWHKALGDIPLRKLNEAFDIYIQANAEPPSVAQLRAIANSLTTKSSFDEEEYWEEHDYWVLTDLNGYHINEFITPKPCSAEDMRAWLVQRGYKMDGTVLKPYGFSEYRPKYDLPYEDGRGRQKVTRQEVEQMFSGIEVETA